MRPRRAMWTSAGGVPTGVTGWHRPRRSTSSASPTSGGGRCKARTSFAKSRRKTDSPRALKSVTRLVQEQPAPADRGAAGLSRSGDPRPLLILRSDGKRQTSGVVPLPSRPHMAEVARTPQPSQVSELGPDERNPQAVSPAVGQVRALMANLRERTCQVRNRVRQSRTLGSVGGGARQRPLLPGPLTPDRYRSVTGRRHQRRSSCQAGRPAPLRSAGHPAWLRNRAIH